MHLILLCIVPFSITIFKALDSNKSTEIIFFFMSGKYWTFVRKRIVASCNFNFVRVDKTTFQLFKSVNDKPFPMGTNMIGTSKIYYTLIWIANKWWINQIQFKILCYVCIGIIFVLIFQKSTIFCPMWGIMFRPLISLTINFNNLYHYSTK